jgi:hypothetical protein
MNSPDQFIGGNFSWFTGVVEDIKDPYELGRVRVRCIGYHSSDKNLIKTEDLPWSTPMTPVTSASMSGIGLSATGILQGSWVIGFFRDGPSAQDPIILGTIPSISSAVDNTKGFSDPDGIYPLKNSLGSPDTPLEARNFEITNAKTGAFDGYAFRYSDAYKKRAASLPGAVTMAQAPKMALASISPSHGYLVPSPWNTWSIENVVNPNYPKNQVFHSESGHVFEVDDTPGKERTLDYHKSGTYNEIDVNGNETTTVVGSKYTVVVGSEHLYVKGNGGTGGYRVTVEGNVRQYVKGNYHLEVEGNKTEYIHGHRQSKILGTDHLDTTKYLETVQTSLSGHPTQVEDNVTLNQPTDVSLVDPVSDGFQVEFASINLNGNVLCKNGASGSFTTVDGKTVTVTKGIITNIYP